jgi:MFS family permease
MAAAGVLQPGRRLVLPLMAVLRLINALFSAANNRLALHLAPRMGRNHFFAIFMVVWQITLGLSPVLWGLLLDAIGDRSSFLFGLQWNRYSVYFALVSLCYTFAFILCGRLMENFY